MKRGETKICGRNACHAVFERRAKDILRVFVSDATKSEFGPLLQWCAKQRRPYRVVAEDELVRVSGAHHHEGVCIVATAPHSLSLREVLRADAPGPLLALADVGNPHNLGAILRSAAHFGVRTVLVAGEQRQLSAAAMRTAEGGAEWIHVVFVRDLPSALAQCRDAGYTIVATSSHAETSLYDHELPERSLVLLGSERHGLSRGLRRLAAVNVAIPGTGHVESLNVATAATLVLAEYWRQHR